MGPDVETFGTGDVCTKDGTTGGFPSPVDSVEKVVDEVKMIPAASALKTIAPTVNPMATPRSLLGLCMVFSAQLLRLKLQHPTGTHCRADDPVASKIKAAAWMLKCKN